MTRDLPAFALEYGLRVGLQLPPPWFVPIEAPACAVDLRVPAAATNDGLARRFVCDKIRGHDGRHRQVTDNDAGETFEWGNWT
jgi:hypothetical protein